jgi:hypothetical protein
MVDMIVGSIHYHTRILFRLISISCMPQVLLSTFCTCNMFVCFHLFGLLNPFFWCELCSKQWHIFFIANLITYLHVAEMGDWDALVPDTTASDGWTSLAKIHGHDDVAANNWTASSQQKPYCSQSLETRSPAKPGVGRQEFEPEMKEIDDIVKSMQRILLK